MGNQNSRSTTPINGHSPSNHAPPSHSQSNTHTQPHAGYPSARRRESIQALTVKAQAAPPSASLESAAAYPTSTRPRSRARTQSTASNTATVASQLRAAQDTFGDKMGNDQSRPKDRDRDREREKPRQLTPPHPPPPPAASRTPEPLPVPMAVPVPVPVQSPQYAPSPHTRPVDVPAAVREEPQGRTPVDAAQDYIMSSSHFSRPPRMPLPIEEETHTPGSPIISPADFASPIDHGEIEGALPNRSSMLSQNAADDDDFGDEFKSPAGRPTVPTLIEWEGEGERVYVTGTFAGWNRKYRLHQDGPSNKPNTLSAYVHIAPGTHHLMFIVDNDMRISDKLPTAVDYTNILVNYLEVSYDDIPAPPSTAGGPVPTPNPDTPAGLHTPQALAAPPPDPVPRESTEKYHQNIPRYLLDLDAAEESSRFARANAVAGNLPTPPTLPGFLGKSILNGTTPMKDDSSVLIMPNHTVLNHLATSSIKDNILATSATTRYRQKFLTTILYKPKEENPERVY
ncbi:carbohydrate-binding module family 48 protein [Dothidotthia symphoricarpi CBS 119687]|uniref:Carbohydrate-binding module family 48 protein n=1 Tax=Dothidotthia symphoricarpi CBS 119687 TaxID=1392245 RepID=A0A6A6ACA0_9PLEO|nr:carbohydrate-binding module family 48 protein [Dothidotthia symphoricarpi CBS 119687]KAF2128341.1 carbohydrate-binding module family 48 protein [Dothidotthia symphoricarpi CBS 119687]